VSASSETRLGARPTSSEQRSRTCLFCGNPADTKGHLFPEWINDPDPAYTLGGERTDVFQIGPERTELRSYRADEVASLSVRALCGACNHGWMSRLERSAKPLLRALALGQPTALSIPEQLLAATWAVKTTIVGEAIMEYPDRFPAEDCAIIREQRQPPVRSRVAIAAFSGQSHVFTRYIRSFNGAYRDKAPGLELCIHTIQIGSLVLQVRETDAPPAAGNRALEHLAGPRYWEIPIFPSVEPCEWPPAAVLNDDALIRYAAGGAEPPELPPTEPPT
jgi:hypothetical protein